jgi:hypothetical protein
MFLNRIKDFVGKKIVKRQLANVPKPSDGKIGTVGILFDETYFHERDALLAELEKAGIARDNISVLVFKDAIRKSETTDSPSFSYKDFKWTARIENADIKSFTQKHFDLLINYYDIEKAPLLLVSHLSDAKFKAGFSSVDKRLHHFMIDTHAENYKVFAHELVKYLRILNKL